MSQEAVTLSGGISAGGELYNVSGIPNRRSPYSYQISGRVVFAYNQLSVPISGSYRDAQFSYDFTFNRIGITPTYKWIKVYLGWNSMNFSQYTMSGRSFNGIGVELRPGNLILAALKGKIQNPLAIKDTLVDGASIIPGYDRLITGAKVGYAKDKNKLEFILLKVKDDLTSFELPEDYNSIYGYNVLTPKENLTLGVNAGVSLFKRFDVYINTGVSAITANAEDTLLIDYGKEVPDFLKDLFQANSTTRLSLAGDGGANFRIKATRLGVKYRRVDPFYSTLAGNYFSPDVEQYTFSVGSSVLKRKIRFDIQLGLESNNLTQLRMNTTHRAIFYGNMNFTPNEKFYSTLIYSNFQTETDNRILLLNDTLRFVSVSSQYGLTSNYNLKNENRTASFTFNAFYNTVRDQSEVEQIGDINILSLSLSHGYQIPSLDLTIGPSINYNRYTYTEVEQNRYGGGLRVSKRLMDKKLNLSLSGTWSLNLYDQQKDGTVSYYLLSSSYKVTPKSTISFQFSFRNSTSLIHHSFDETRTFLRYNHNF
ncbi:MAG TPA: hypothetical protein VFG10_05800 [Saprospiraceae bacterium]|nr:hypothetical protein [Saprospiraceae bacterium]